MRRLVALASALAFAVLAGCGDGGGSKEIAEVVSAPKRHLGKKVIVEGVVSGASDISRSGKVVHRSYVLRQEGASLTVITDGALPPVGERLRVEGKLEPSGSSGNLALGPRLRELKRERQ